MELPLSLKFKLKLLGILPWHQSSDTIFSIQYLQILIIIVVLIDVFVFFVRFIALEATIFQEYAQAALSVVIGFFYLVIYLRFVWGKRKFIEFIDELEKRINTSKLIFAFHSFQIYIQFIECEFFKFRNTRTIDKNDIP